MKENSIEKVILIVLWVSSIGTFSIALFLGYSLFFSDLVGLLGLAFVTGIYFLKRNLLLAALTVLLFIGMLNLASFVYFLNVGIRFKTFGNAITPGIQFYSLVLFFILALFRRPVFLGWINRWTGNSKENLEENHHTGIELFKKKFSLLSREEIQKKLKLPLSSEAGIALQQLLEEKNAEDIATNT